MTDAGGPAPEARHPRASARVTTKMLDQAIAVSDDGGGQGPPARANGSCAGFHI